jgi:hypothetical protein
VSTELASASSGLLDSKGRPMARSDYAKNGKKIAPPITGEKFGNFAGRSLDLLSLPGGGIVQFDLGALTLTDYRAMRTHYQVNSSLSVLSFMQHQSNWTIEHSDSKVVDFMSENLGDIWTQLNRGMSQANWAGFSPNVLQYDNDANSNAVVLTKVKDLIPEECGVNWKLVDGYVPPGSNSVPPKIKIYDGIKQLGWPQPIPTDNTFWYPILMENGDYYGNKILKSAYTSYFFSMLLHLFSNRYYERFGEPTPIGRAPQDELISLPDGQGGYTQMPAHEYMMFQLQQLRSRSVVVLPSDRDMDTNGRGYFDYDLQYLESQMRGADFERYMQRLDEEISLAIFTPVLLMKTADVGSYNLGVGHMQMYLWMLNAINADRAQYINKYILAPLYYYNFGTKGKTPKIKFNKLDNTNAQMLQLILQALIGQGAIKFDMKQLGEMAGLTIEETQQTLKDPTGLKPDDNIDPNTAGGDPKGSTTKTPEPGILNLSSNVRDEIIKRVQAQVAKAYNDGEFNKDFELNIGFRRKMERALSADGVSDAGSAAYGLYGRLDAYSRDLSALGRAHTSDSDAFMKEFTGLLDYELNRLVE